MAAPDLLFPQLLIRLWEQRFTGHLDVRAEDVRTGIYFQSGVPVFAERGRIGDTLGRLLVRMGKIDEEQYRRAIDVMTEKLVQNESVRLGEVLIELGIVGPEEVFEALRMQVRQKILACFEWAEFEHRLQTGEEFLAEVAKFPCPVDELVIEGIAAHFDAERTARLLARERDRYPALLQAPDDLAKRFHFSGPELRFVSQVDGKKSLNSMVRSGPLDPGAAQRVLLTCKLAGALDLRNSPQASLPPPSQPSPPPPILSDFPPPSDPREGEILREYIRVAGHEANRVLSVRPNAAPEEVEQAFRRQSAPFAPDAVREVEEPAWRYRAGEIFDSMRRARDHLMARRGSWTRPGPTGDDRRDRLEAERAFQNGKRYLERGEHNLALGELEHAASILPDEREYELLLTWARFVTTDDDNQRLLARAKARGLAISVLRQDANHCKAHYVLGHLLRVDGEEEAAQRHFLSAYEADPNDLDAKREFMRLKKRRR